MNGTLIKSVDLFYQEGSSDKVYFLQIEENKVSNVIGYVVNFSYGRRGNAMQTGTKTNSPVTFYEAEKIYQKILNEKLGKGYKISSQHTNNTTTKVTKIDINDIPSLIPVVKKEVKPVTPKCVLLNPISEERANEILQDDNWIVQEKMDGVRFMLDVKNGVFILQSKGYNRKGQEVPVPNNIKKMAENLPTCFLDGELVGDVFHVFDMIGFHECEITHDDFETRYQLLEKNIKPNDSLKIVKIYHGKDKVKFYDSVKTVAEGVVFKKKSATYHVGRPASGGDYLKFKFCESCTCIVTKVSNKRSVSIGLYEGDKIVEMGNVTIPANYDIPKEGSVVEVRYLYAYKNGSLYQPVYLGERDDVDVDNVDSIKYKNE
jgi:bifunctional non-homologous end joining protein LigD